MRCCGPIATGCSDVLVQQGVSCLLSIDPKVDFDYVYNVPDDQPVGTFCITRTSTVPAQYRSAAAWRVFC